MAFKFVLLSALLAVANAGYIGSSGYAVAPAVTKVVNPAHDAVASTHQNVHRSFAGTVSQYSKAIDTPYSSVRKEDTRITNNVYTPSAQATHTVYTHAAPLTQTVYTHAVPQEQLHYQNSQHDHQHHEHQQYEHEHEHEHEQYQSHQPALYTHAVPTTKTVTYSAPAQAQVYQHSAPAPQVYHPIEQPQEVYHHVAPARQLYHHSAPAPTVTTTTYNHGPAASTYTHNAPGVAAYGSSQTVHYSPAEMVSHMSFDGFGTHWGY